MRVSFKGVVDSDVLNPIVYEEVGEQSRKVIVHQVENGLPFSKGDRVFVTGELENDSPSFIARDYVIIRNAVITKING